MRRRMLKIYWRMRSRVAPKLKFAQELYEDALKAEVNLETTWLDLGCGHHVLPLWRGEQEKALVSGCRMIVGMDYDLPSLVKHRSISHRVRGDISRLPFPDNYFNLVTANMVVEHLSDPEVQFREIHRILKPGGTFLFHTPNAHGYPALLTRMVPDRLKYKLVFLLDGRNEGDVFETHYAANTRKKIASLAASAGFEVAKIRMIVSDAVFSHVPPIALTELVSIRLLMTGPLRPLRTNIIASLRKTSENEHAPARKSDGS
jgi:ubiquinone/menaquinone biosynthesis C-methylase UbiE